MAAKVLNIEVGKRLVKVCLSVKSGKAYRISESFSFPTPEGSVSDGQIVDAITLGSMLKNEIIAHQIATNVAVFSITSSKIAVREVMLPPVKDDQIRTIVNTNASDYFPIDTNKYAIAPAVLERDKADSRTMVVAVPTALVEGYTALADAAGLVIQALDYSGNSQYQVLRTIDTEGVTMYVTIDAEAATVLFMEGGKLLMQRSLSIGGDEMIMRYIEQNGISESDFIQGLNMLSVTRGKVYPEGKTEAANAAMQKLISGIARSLDFFRSSKYADKIITRAVLMGSCCHLYGIKEAIADTIGAPAYWLEEIEDIAALANSIDSISLFINCLGARIAPMGFLPKDYLERTKGGKKSSDNQNIGIIIFAGLLVVSAVLVGWGLLGNITRKAALGVINQRIEQLSPYEKTYKAFLSYQKADKDLQTFVDTKTTPNEELKAFFEEMEEKMPSEIEVLSAECDLSGVIMSVEVPEFEDAAVVIRQFRSFESIDVITVGTITKNVEEDTGVETISFVITCAYPVPEVETTTKAPKTTATTTEKSK